MILPVPSASLSISSHSMTCKLQNSVPSPLSLAPEVAPATKLHQLAWQHRRRERENLASQTFGPSQSLTIFVAMQASCKHHHRHPMARCKANFSKELRSLNDMPSMMQLPRALFFAKEWRGSPRVFQPQWLRGSGRHNPAHCKYNIIQ